ncbi:MAG: type II CAAX endopeptidase family protein [Acidobacteriaceae bacterium]
MSAPRGRAFLRFLLAIAWLAIAYFLSDRGARGFTHGPAFPLLRNLFQIFLLIVGYSYMELAWDKTREPMRTMGLVARSGAGREFALGAALGWGMVTATILVIALAGHFYVRLLGSAHAWAILILQLLTLAAGSLAAELAFRGYPFQKLVQATGPFSATVLAGIFFAFLRMETPGATATALWISGVAAVLLSIAYLRTRALWLCWGVHFAWLASVSLLFGQPLAGVRYSSSVIQTYIDGPRWLTGSEYGPEGSLITLIVLWIGIYVLIRMTRDLAWNYTQPELKPAGIPMDLSHPMHPAAPPAAASAPAQPAPKAGLVQIAPADPPNPVSGATQPDSSSGFLERRTEIDSAGGAETRENQ